MPMSSNRRQSNGPPHLLIAGASARAAAFSVVRIGRPFPTDNDRFTISSTTRRWPRVAAADLFADTDLCEIAEAKHISDWPNGVLEWTKNYPSHIPFVYVGGLENVPELLDQIAQDRPIAGITGKLLRDLRDPAFLDDWCARGGFRVPRSFSADDEHVARLLVKPIRGVAGLGIRHFDGTPLGPDEYLQEFIAGKSLSAAYLCTVAGAELLGTFRQLPPEKCDSPSLPPFLYRGSVTHALSSKHRLLDFGAGLHALGARGLCGVDFIETAEGDFVILEINPRYTAGMELLEQQTGRSLIGEHLACFDVLHPRVRPIPLRAAPSITHRGKRIVFARRPIRWRTPAAEILPPFPNGARSYADLPRQGERIGGDEPICTIFAEANSFDDCRRELLAREQRLLSLLETSGGSG